MIADADLQTLNDEYFSELDKRFARFVCGERSESVDLYLAAALVSYFRSLGHVCVDLNQLAIHGVPHPREMESGTGVPLVADREWGQRLRIHADVVGPPGSRTPLILDAGGQLYLYRFWRYETKLAGHIQSRLRCPSAPHDPRLLALLLDRYFPPQRKPGTDGQRTAARRIVTHPFTILTGGPGTGKTTVLAASLAMMCELAGDRPPRIALAAPTGKAAVRLRQAVATLIDGALVPETVRCRIPDSASTIHRLLGYMPAQGKYRFNGRRKLPLDVIVIDEASMVDLPLLVHLFDALPVACRIVLSGDHHQLASVQPGSVLADVCGSVQGASVLCPVPDSGLPPESSATPGATVGTAPEAEDGCVLELTTNYRSGEASGLHRFAVLVRRGCADEAWEMLTASAECYPDLEQVTMTVAARREVLEPYVTAAYGGDFRTDDPCAMWTWFARSQFLCALRHGPFGTLAVNRLIYEILATSGVVAPGMSDAHYHGQPIMILKNDYDLGLFNGDCGIVMKETAGVGLAACFRTIDGDFRQIPLARLPVHEPCYAITVHKAQGSEFSWIGLIMPDRPCAIVTRALLYTAITRATSRCCVFTNAETMRAGIETQHRRYSGLAERMGTHP